MFQSLKFLKSASVFYVLTDGEPNTRLTDTHKSNNFTIIKIFSSTFLNYSHNKVAVAHCTYILSLTKDNTVHDPYVILMMRQCELCISIHLLKPPCLPILRTESSVENNEHSLSKIPTKITSTFTKFPRLGVSNK